MSRKLLEAYVKRDQEIGDKLLEIGMKAPAEGRNNTPEELAEITKYLAERKENRKLQAEFRDGIQHDLDEEQARKSQDKPVDPPTSAEQRAREEQEEQERKAGQIAGHTRKFKTLGDQLRSVIIAGSYPDRTDPELRALNELYNRRAATGMSEGIDADGGFLLEPEIGNELIEASASSSVLFGRVLHRPISGRSLRLKGIDEHSKKKGYLAGGIQIYPTAEAEDVKTAKVKFSQLDFDLKKISVMVYLTDEELDDIQAIEARVNQEVTKAFGYEMDGYIFEGDGVKVGEGMKNADCLQSVALEASQTTANPLLTMNVAKMRSRLLPGTRQDSIFLIQPELEPYMVSLAIGNTPVFISMGGITNAPSDRLMGIPVVPFDHCEAANTKGDIVLTVPNRYLLVEKAGGFKMQSSIHVEFVKGEKALRFDYRYDAKFIDRKALEPRKGTLKLSPIVTLDTRSS